MATTSQRIRLDALLVQRGLFESRSKAAASVMAGSVSLGGGDRRATKPGAMVAGDVELSVAETRAFVSRGGVKLRNALDGFALDPTGLLCLDAGASTGGFSDCLLQAGAQHVVAVDVAYGELSWKLRNDERVTVIERCNVRNVVPADLPYAPQLIVADLSFIGLAKVLPALSAVAAGRFDLLALVKPQFELGRERVGKGGVVRSPGDRREALVRVGERAIAEGLAVHGYCSSGLPGPAGNRESFIWCSDGAGGDGIGTQDLYRAALQAEPEDAT